MAQAATLLRSLDHTQLDTQSVGLLWTSDQPVAEAATCSTHNNRKGRTCKPSAGFEPVIPAVERPQTYALDRTATGFSGFFFSVAQQPNLDLARLIVEV